jgi:hypothetical protein
MPYTHSVCICESDFFILFYFIFFFGKKQIVQIFVIYVKKRIKLKDQG